MKVGAGFARFLTVFSLLSRIPVKRSFEIDFDRADFWIPAVSPLVSMASIGGFAAGMALTRHLGLAIVASIALQYFLFNLFHFDGLIDSADALLPAASREKRLEILKDPRIGSYGFFCGLLALALRAGAMVLLAERGLLFSALAGGLLAAPVAGRSAAVFVAWRMKPARTDGLGALMRNFSLRRIIEGSLVGLFPLVAFCGIFGSWPLLIIALVAWIAGTLLTALLVGSAYTRAIGGFTGDSLGAAIEWGEIATLLVLGIVLRFYGTIIV
ncbi:MAG: adenosylcobinamide-GDP ribazoletransferase [Spirochaetia bacterium]|jgi:adenosylcobinamide-GDP ribazoletransferase|nr:adenosylcobinamide-GDP ribazoletransferase [Spirochaetia bacterium]